MSTTQPSLPIARDIPVGEIETRLSFAAAIELCANAAGYDLDKQSSAKIGMDKARWSRIKSGNEGIKWDQLQAFMDACANDAPLLWMLHQRGYEVRSIQKRASEKDKRIRRAGSEARARAHGARDRRADAAPTPDRGELMTPPNHGRAGSSNATVPATCAGHGALSHRSVSGRSAHRDFERRMSAWRAEHAHAHGAWRQWVRPAAAKGQAKLGVRQNLRGAL